MISERVRSDGNSFPKSQRPAHFTARSNVFSYAGRKENFLTPVETRTAEE